MKQILKYTLSFLVFLSFASCEKFVEDINESPNNPQNASMENILNAALLGIIIGHEGEDARLAAMWSRQFTGSDRQYSSYDVYLINAEGFEWDKYYLVAKNAELAIDKAQEKNNSTAIGIAKVIKAHALGTVASLWGDVPFSEAIQFPDIEDPKFDAQSDVYAGVQALLDEGIAELEKGVGSVSGGVDFYFAGSNASWLGVAHTLKARFYMHVGNYDAAAASAANGIQSNSGNWMISHGTSYNVDMNIYYSFGVFDREGYMTANNAILPALLDTASATYRGNAKTNETARFNHVFSGGPGAYDLNYGGMWAADASFPLLTAVENHLIAAEAAVRNGDDAGGLASLNAARAEIQAQYPDGVYESLEDSDISDDGLLHDILEEKYCALIGQIEVFNDLRRTDNALGIPATDDGNIPERFLVPQVEIDANANAPDPIPELEDPTPVNM